ncbi:hypothetical protein LZ198_10570 [Myxococcus sp. K15C18031901]|uniref:hypothetical protein n=1 Tax=Myxococcus dinghuensis TaxID=2906761 RepID=UPI0020A7877F|nr:hypothetical protein [Myxococcus dinghuensis]MCP3099313.1 hypothetical protein [Myxococcus dinghuensis]
MRVTPEDEGSTHQRFDPRRVEIPATGTVTLTLQARTEGTTLELRTKGRFPATTFLLPFAAPRALALLDDEHAQGSARLSPEQPEPGRLVFRNLPPGRFSLLIIEPDERGYHLEEFDLPAEGTVVREVTPAWRPHTFSD